LFAAPALGAQHGGAVPRPALASVGGLVARDLFVHQTSAVEQTYHFSQGTLFVSAATTNLCPDFAG
jgi:hypothetical protein